MLTVITGCMFAGKSTTLISKVSLLQSITKGTAIAFKPIIDTRYSSTSIVTHDGVSLPCTPVSAAESILQFAREYSIVAIDEAQFFDGTIVPICRALADGGKQVFVAGLSTDYLGRPFGSMPSLLAIADNIVKVYGECACGEKSTHNKRISKQGGQVLVGGEADYVATCRRCFREVEKLGVEEAFTSL